MRAMLLLSACVAAASSPDLSPGGFDASEGCAFEEAALLQQRVVRAARAEFPDFGFGKLARSVITGAVDDATAKANEVVGSALSTAGDAVNGTVGKVQASVDAYAARVNETAGSIKAGVAALLADAFKVKVPGLNVTQEDKDLVLSLVGKADEIVQAALSSVTATSSLLDQLPEKAFNMTESVNASFQAASSRCRSFSAALQEIVHFFEDAAGNFTRKKAAMLLTPSGWFLVPHHDASDIVFAHAALLGTEAAEETPSAALARLEGALMVAQEELQGFSGSFVQPFEALSDSVADLALSEGAARVDAAFGGAADTARGVADRAGAAFAQLLAGISEGAAEASLPNAGHALSPSRGLLVAAAVLAKVAAAAGN